MGGIVARSEEDLMADVIRVGIIGLDTSHAIEFPRRMQAPDLDPALHVEGLRAATCLRFVTPFQNEEQLDGRQAELERWGVRVTRKLEDALEGVDALMLEINDPAFHLDYFRRCAGLGKPIFLDKPLADTLAAGRRMAEIAREHGTRWWSSSSLRHVPAVREACAAVRKPSAAIVYGPLGKAPAGSSIVWYGVHAFEMLEAALGRGARSVLTRQDSLGAVAVVDYPDQRRAVVELTEGSWIYGGYLREREKAHHFVADLTRAYTEQLVAIREFFRGGPPPVAAEDALEVMGMLDAAERSLASGKPEVV
jgi:predicted dehydrogenase